MTLRPNDIRVTANAPYPPVEVSAPNTLYAKLLTAPLASAGSEMTAVSTYLYQHWYLHTHCRDLSDLFRRISQVEMHHLETLGLLIAKLGGNPELRRCRHPNCCDPVSCSCAYWSGSMIDYKTDVKEILKSNIQAEKSAVREYKELVSKIRDPQITAVLKRIIMDEELHMSIFESLLKKCR